MVNVFIVIITIINLCCFFVVIILLTYVDCSDATTSTGHALAVRRGRQTQLETRTKLTCDQLHLGSFPKPLGFV